MSEPLQIEEFLRYMPGVARCERALGELNFAWRLIESTAKMVCPSEAKTILPIIKSTREGFNDLENQLIVNLVHENIAKSAQEINFKAQVIIDIVVRNLFERTADVGFLAMDDAICEFVLNEGKNKEAMILRLKEYREKYTVYDEIVILDTNGNVVANLDHNNVISHSKDALIAKTLHSNSYVETFGKSDLRPHLDQCLIYSRKIVHPKTSVAIGVLCLCFQFENEMQGVFSGLRKEDDRSIMLMLDQDSNVIATSDAYHIPLGRVMTKALKGEYELVSYAGKEYIAKTCAAHGYQGYAGPGWFGHVMIPFETAFRQSKTALLSSSDTMILPGVMAHAQSFCLPLYEVITKAETINVTLRRVVWNGQIMSSRQRGDLLKLKSILQEISQTGDKTRQVFSNSIKDLYSTVISTSLQDIQYISRLMIDIMDRNLYERANDCRWWALSPDICKLMALPNRTQQEIQKITDILEAINALYTVYTRLVVFNVQGEIIAASNLHQDDLEVVGRSIEMPLLQNVLALKSSQEYCVTEFESTWLYNDRPTYVYCAAIRQLDHPHRIVGGIGIVFDSEKEFEAMLQSSLPKRAGAFAVFADRSGHVISSTYSDLPPGSTFLPEACMFNQSNGSSEAKIIVYNAHYMISGYTTSFGYREYKNSGDYKNDIVAMVLVPLGAKTDIQSSHDEASWADWRDHPTSTNTTEFATFLLNDAIYALPVSTVVGAVEYSRVTATSTLKPLIIGMLNFQNDSDGTDVVIPVVDLFHLLEQDAPLHSEVDRQVIVIQQGTHFLGLLVGHLHDVLEFNASLIEPAPQLFFGQKMAYVSELIKIKNHQRMIQIVELKNLVQYLF